MDIKNYKYRNDIEKIQREIATDIKVIEARIEAWKNVKRMHRKDGSDFVQKRHNFKNAFVDNDNVLHPVIKVNYYTTERGYDSDSINIYVNDKSKTSGRPLHKISPYVPYYTMTIDEIFCNIEVRINILEEQKESLEKQYELVESVFTDFARKIESALSEMKESAGGKNNTLYYACREFMTTAY